MSKFVYNYPHLDAGSNAFFQRDLELISKEMFDIKYAKLKALQLIPVDMSLPAGIQTWTYRQFDSLGEAKLITDFAKDLPMVNVEGDEVSVKFKNYGAAFGYSIEEIEAGAMEGGPQLDRQRAEACRKTLDQKLDKAASVGDATAGLLGLLNQANTTTFTPGDKDAGGTSWLDGSGNIVATAEEMLKDLHGMIRKVVVDTKEVERPTRIILPTGQYMAADVTPRSDNSDVTVLKYFMSNSGVEVVSWERCAGAGTNGADLAVAYDPKPLNVRLLLPIPYQQMMPQLDNMAYKVNARLKTGGVISPFPKSICYASGI